MRNLPDPEIGLPLLALIAALVAAYLLIRNARTVGAQVQRASTGTQAVSKR